MYLARAVEYSVQIGRTRSSSFEWLFPLTGFRASESGRRKKPFQKNNSGPSSLDRILDRPCQIHGTPDKPANHTNRDCWVFKQAGKLNAGNKEKGSQSEDDNEEPRPPNIGGQKKFPPR